MTYPKELREATRLLDASLARSLSLAHGGLVLRQGKFPEVVPDEMLERVAEQRTAGGIDVDDLVALDQSNEWRERIRQGEEGAFLAQVMPFRVRFLRHAPWP